MLTAAVVRRGRRVCSSKATTHSTAGSAASLNFPSPANPQFLLRYTRRFGDDEAVRMVLHTCDRMAAGGIHDQLGGGFARYSVDARMAGAAFREDAL